MGLLWSQARSSVDEGEWLASERQKRALGSARAGQAEFGWEHRHRAALVRHCVLAGLSCLPATADRFLKKSALRTIFPCGFSRFWGFIRLLLPIVRSLAHLPDVAAMPTTRVFLTRLSWNTLTWEFPGALGPVSSLPGLAHGWGLGFEVCQSVFRFSYRNQPAPRDSGAGPGPAQWRGLGAWSDEPQE
jgi:hypothetical protein